MRSWQTWTNVFQVDEWISSDNIRPPWVHRWLPDWLAPQSRGGAARGERGVRGSGVCSGTLSSRISIGTSPTRRDARGVVSIFPFPLSRLVHEARMVRLRVSRPGRMAGRTALDLSHSSSRVCKGWPTWEERGYGGKWRGRKRDFLSQRSEWVREGARGVSEWEREWSEGEEQARFGRVWCLARWGRTGYMAGALGENPSQQQRIMAKRVYQVWKGSNVSGLLLATPFMLWCFCWFCFVPEPWDAELRCCPCAPFGLQRDGERFVGSCGLCGVKWSGVGGWHIHSGSKAQAVIFYLCLWEKGSPACACIGVLEFLSYGDGRTSSSKQLFLFSTWASSLA